MQTSFLKKLQFLVILVLLFSFKVGSAQVKYDAISFRIDSLASVGLPASALKEVDRLEKLARENKNAPEQIRAIVYRMTFESYLEQDALTAIISRLKLDIAQSTYPVKPVLQSLLGEMYWKYYQQYRYQYAQRSRLAKPDTDFTKWDLQTIISETGNLYKLSLQDAEKEQTTPISVLDGALAGNSTTRYLRPTLYDLLLQRAFEFYLADEPAINKPKMPFSLNDPAFFSDSHTFAELQVKTTDTASTYYEGLKLLQQGTAFHLKMDQQEALADINLQRLRFLYGKSAMDNKDSLYLSALHHIATDFAQKPISAEALAMMGQYFFAKDSLTVAHQYYKQAKAAYPQSLGGKNAELQLEMIEQKDISATVEDIYAPGKPLLAKVNYKNISSAKVLIYKLSQGQYNDYFISPTPPKNMSVARYQLNLVKALKLLQEHDLDLKTPGDYRKHAAEFKIESLDPGSYALLVKGDGSDIETLESIGSLRVSGLAYMLRINPEGNVQALVTTRETGEPLSGVSVELAGRTYKYTNGNSQWEDVTEKGVTGDDGFFTTKKLATNSVSITLKTDNEILTDGNKYFNGSRDNSDDDDEPEDKTVLFTDRQIYRPGQTIYFKALQLQVIKGKNKIMPGKDITVQFMDVNNKEVSSLKLKTNEFGTVSGSFIIPQTMLDGEVELKTDDGTINVKVEEYKRPTFQVEFSPVKESLKLNDTVTVKGKVTAFSGYGLSQARVAYHITRNQNYDYRYSQPVNKGRYRYNYQTAEIKTDTVTTDGQGNYTIKFIALRDNDEPYQWVNYRYTINADVTDASGETHSAQTSVTVGSNDISIRNYIPDQLFAKDSLSTEIAVENLNGQAQKADVKVEIYALKNPGRVYKTRLWPKPDQYILSTDDFKNDFPEYAYKNEDAVDTWQTAGQVSAANIKCGTDKPGIADLNALRKQPSGMYRVMISARNEKGDTISLIKYIDLVASSPKPAKTADWVIAVQNEVKPGMQAEFLVGMGQKINVLVERFNGPKLVSSHWETIEDGQQRFKFSVSNKDKDPAVQFMTIYQDRVYASYQKIYVVDPDKMLQMKLLTFHNKLQPGEKEQWKLQVTNLNNEKQSAEMVAALYDASLDDLTTAQDWRNLLDDPNRYHPDYFNWETYSFLREENTMPVFYNIENYGLITRDYEHLNLFGYNYYGGYNNGYQEYLRKAREHVSNSQNEKRLQVEYLNNAKKVKNGYDVTGKILGDDDKQPIVAAVIRIKGSNIGTVTDVNGFFRIKVPTNATLVISYIGYETFSVVTTQSESITVKLKPIQSALMEVVVTGYQSQKKKDITGSVSSITIRGRGFIPVTAKEVSVTTAENMLQGQSAGVTIRTDTSLFLRRALVPITIRKNFNETAFFYPQLHTDSAGKILIDFTIPEALTKWRFKAFAHTKDLKSGYLESTVVTQKQLSISANMPRFMREGDTLTVSARLANLTSDKLKGTVTLQLFNALNMQPVSLLLNASEAKQKFEVEALTNKAVSFTLVIPKNLDALTYRLTADAGTYSDGEENTLPVLPNRMLVTESMPMMIRSGQDKTFTFDKLLNNTSTTLQNKSLTLEYTQNPAWYAVQALPYMMEFPYECSEQVFSRYYANSLATNLVNRMPVIKQVFEQWKSSNSTELLSNLEKNQELKYTLLEETPWLRDATNESEQKKRIALLFDLNKMSGEMQLNLDKLQQRQLPDGGFTWFAGDQADRYITQHIVEGIGQLYHLHIPTDASGELRVIADNAVGYLDGKLVEDDKEAKKYKGYETRSIYATEIHAWYARSFYPDQKMSGELKKAFANYMVRAEKQWLTQNIYEQGMIALTMLRNGKPLIANAIIKSLTETAKQSDDMGMYWGKNMLGYFWYESPIETQSLMIGLFTEAGGDEKAVEEMKIWLLRNKQASDWQTTKATAAACYALLMKQDDWLSPENTSDIKLGGQELSTLKPGIKADAGTGYIKTSWADEQVKPVMGKVEIKNNGKSISWGAMHWQYLEQLDKITPSKTDIQLERKYFILKQTDSGPVVTAVDGQHQPKTGDLLKVIVYLKAGRDFEYVQLKDMRPAGTEPVSVLSEYKYQDGLWYYQVTKDVATNFFISYLNKGNYVFEYQLRVAQPGDFSTGITTIQCMYAPEFNAHSEGKRVTFKP